MSEGKAKKSKPNLWQVIRQAFGPYKRLCTYVMPYKWRFILGLGFGVAFGLVNSFFPLAVARVTNFIFHGSAPNLSALRSHPELLNHGPKINSIAVVCLSIPAIMTVRSLFDYLNTYYMQWVSNKVVTDIRSQLFSKMVRHSMDFFNKTRAGFLMSRITNDTRAMQAALAIVSSDLFKQPIAIVGGVTVLLLMDWKFTVVTLILFPICMLPIRIYGRRARGAMEGQQEEMGQMVVTMQETFAGIRVIKSFSREQHQEDSFRRSNQVQFSQMMRIIRSTESVGPLVETIAASGVGLALLYVYAVNLSAGRFFGLISGIFLLYNPIKTLSRIHIIMQRSIMATGEIFRILDSEPTVKDRPDAIELKSCHGLIEFDHVMFHY
ncbi:MAG: ABC transporter transmembrane domain-containing protein, partial [Chthoniobacterales bacterium]